MVAATASVAVVVALAVDNERPVDGEFVLDEPGIYSQPVTTADVNGEPLPDVTLEDADGVEQPWAQFDGRPAVINIWYSTCPPCAKELADFAEVSAEHFGHVQFVGVNPRDDPSTMTEFGAARGVDYPLLLDPEQAFVYELGITSYPTTLFVSADGEIVHQTNAISADELNAAIDEYLV